MNIIKEYFPDNQYKKIETPKKQIVIHHTVSGQKVNGDITWWLQTPQPIATHFIIDREGIVHQLFDEKYWGYHLGCANKHFQSIGLSYRELDKFSIGIELDSWGPVLPAPDGKFYPVKWENGKYLPNTKCAPVPYFYEYCNATKWRGHKYYEKYTTLQLGALKELLQNLCKVHRIPLIYKEDIWTVCPRALSGSIGIFSHSSYRIDKSDVHPQPELINILKTL